MKILVCGTRKKGYGDTVWNRLESYKNLHDIKDLTIIEGCCPGSADEYAEQWCEKSKVVCKHYPGTPNNYLKRNIEMVSDADIVLAFWDGWSYGTAHTIAHATMNKKQVIVIKV